MRDAELSPSCSTILSRTSLKRSSSLLVKSRILKKQNLEENNKVIKIVSDDIFINSKLKVPIQCDGEFIGCLPVQIKNTKRTINLLVKEELNVQAD